MSATLHTDGACLGNPGPMGLGIALNVDGELKTQSIPFGIGTNNIAEYSALIHGLEFALQNGVSSLDAFLDSKLVVEQVNGNWRVKDEKLQPLHKQAVALLEKFDRVTVSHVRRESNTQADALSKAAAERV